MANRIYYCFSEQGEVQLPHNTQLAKIISQDIEPILFLDSCVCLHIIKAIDYGKKASQVDLQQLIALKIYLALHHISANPFFGLIELCTRNYSLDTQKLWDLKGRLDCFELLPVKVFKNFSYDFHRDFKFSKNLDPALPNIYDTLAPSLLNSYCALLKMRSIAKSSGLSKTTAVKSIRQFLDWMISELDSVRGIEYQLALHIFGGHTRFRKMIGLDSQPSEVKKYLLGTAWDIFHAKTSANSFRLYQLLGRNIQPFFLTSDANLFNLLRQMSLRVIKDGSEEFTTSFIHNACFDFPHLEKSFIYQQNQYMMETFTDRTYHQYEFEAKKLDRMIRELEIANGFS